MSNTKLYGTNRKRRTNAIKVFIVAKLEVNETKFSLIAIDAAIVFSVKLKIFSQEYVEDAGVDSATLRMLSARSTIWANPPRPEKFNLKCNTTSYE